MATARIVEARGIRLSSRNAALLSSRPLTMNRPSGYAPGRRTRMTFPDDERPRRPPTAQPGEALADLSIEELKARVEIYRAEIERLSREIEAKERSRQAADSFFRR
jgi:uncharacterized small protein (DUF1192 family)